MHGIAQFFHALALVLICMGAMWEAADRDRPVMFSLAGLGAFISAACCGMATIKLGWVVL